MIAKELTQISLNNKYNTNKHDVETILVDLDHLIKKVDKQLRVPDK